MKRALKIWLIVAAAFFVAGIGSAIIGFSLVNFQFQDLNQEGETVYESYTVQMKPGEVSEIEVGAVDTPVTLQRTDGDKIVVRYAENDKRKVKITEQGDKKLWICQDDGNNWYDYIMNWDFLWSGEIVVEVPKTFTGDIDIDAVNGSITLTDLGDVGDVLCRTSNGSFDAQNINAKQSFVFHGTNGHGVVENIKAGEDVVLTTSNVWISAASVTAGGSFDVSDSNATIRATDINANGCTFGTSNGSLDLHNVTAEEQIDATTSNNGVLLDQISGKEIYARSSNGSIEGTIIGKKRDFMIRASTSNGKNNLPDDQQEGSKRLDLQTSNGNIDIAFTED